MLHCGRCLPEGLLALRLRLRTGTPYVCFAHGEEVNLSGPSWWRGRAYHSRKVALAAGVVLRQARGVIANSHNTRSILTDRWGLRAERVHVLHPGVDTARFFPAAADALGRGELGWGGRTVLLTVGRLQRRKGHDVLIAALPLVRRRFPDVLYAIVGDGEERGALGELARRLGVEEAVQFRGEAGDGELVRCYQQCDLFVLPNRDIDGDIEGFGMVLLEAQSCGRPVLAGASGGTAEALSAGETGELAPCTDPAAVAERICALLADRPRLAAMGRAGRAWVTARFGWDGLALQAAALFNDLAASGHGARAGVRAGSSGSSPPAAAAPSIPGRHGA
jgi:phosphatidylinositol alpha-1,6-mannosyltransferase